MDLAKQLPASSGRNVREIAHDCGYTSGFYFSKAFTKHVGIGPSVYRERMALA